MNFVFTDADITVPCVHFRQSPGMASLALMLSHDNSSQQHNNSRSVGGGDQFASQLCKDPSPPPVALLTEDQHILSPVMWNTKQKFPSMDAKTAIKAYK